MALKSAVDQLSTDVDAKVDRMEMERIESYFGTANTSNVCDVENGLF